MTQDWTTNEWKRQQGRISRKKNERERAIRKITSGDNPLRMPQVTNEGLYWFTDLYHGTWLVQIIDAIKGKSKMIRWGTTEVIEVDSVGVGEFIEIRGIG